jgi:energy-coupling factor transport system ATP-binding protein
MWRQWQKDGKCLILVTHDVELAARACGRILILEQGKITADGPTSEVLSSNTDFQPQLVRIFLGFGWLTVKEAVNGLSLMSEG